MEEIKYGWWLPPDLSVQGQGIDQLINVLHWFMLALFVGWGIFLIYCLIRFRQRPGCRAEAHSRHFKLPTWLEVGVAIVEIVLLVFVSQPIWAKVKNEFPAEKDSLVIHVVAEQFAWNIHYAGRDGRFGKMDPSLVDGTNPLGLNREDPDSRDDIFSINNLHIPVAKPIIVYLTSKDVIHSFFLPLLRVKQDVIPGMTIPVWFQAVMPAKDLQIACAQLCGVGHTTMKGELHIDTPEEFAAWMAEQEKELEEMFGESEGSTP